jgi:hypothetical protein
MKHKFSKKLVLNKTTISHLDSKEMTAINGGLYETDPRACDTDYRCSVHQTVLYTCVAGCPPCPTGVMPIKDID